MTKSNFGRYFRYKLSKSKSSIIIFAILNFLSMIFPCIILLTNYNDIRTMMETYSEYFYSSTAFDDAFNFMKISAVICMIMITVITVKSVKIYHNRAAMDTLGCLPLSYGERFWGDLLSSISANFISFVPFSIITLMLINAIKSLFKNISESYYPFSETMEKIKMFPYFVLILMVVYIGIYAVTTFISSCCGKFGSSVLFSFIAMAVIPGIYTVYANYFFSFVIGADASKEISSNIFILPPLGPVFSVIMRLCNPNISYITKYDLSYLIKQPGCIMVSILIIAAFIAGAYFIGKKRKAEKTGEEFVFKTVFHILSLTLLVMIIGVIYLNFFEKKGITGILTVLLISFLFYIILELSQNKSFKGFWKTVIRFTTVFGACIAFLMIVKTTNSFNYYKNLPSENSIKEIRVSGDYFYSETGLLEKMEYIYKAKDSVSVILSEHKKLLMSDDISTGNKLNITYVTKGGREITRGYSVKSDGEQIKDFSDEVKKLKEYDPGAIGILGNSDLSGVKAFFDFIKPHNDNISSGYIREDKINKLVELLRYDIENNFFNDNEMSKNTIGFLIFLDIQGDKHGNTLGAYRILTTYKDTLDFLNDPDNYVNLGNDSPASYEISYGTNEAEGLLTDISICISVNDTNEYAKELLSYIETKNSTDGYSSGILIFDNNGLGGYGIRLENKNAAIKAMLKLFREKYTQ